MAQQPPPSRFLGVTDLSCVSNKHLTFHSSPPKLTHATSSLAVTEDTVLVTLQERYISHKPYTSLSPAALVFLSPYSHLPIDDEESLLHYVEEYYQCNNEEGGSRNEQGWWKKKMEQPHVFQLALSAYYNMRRTGQDQVIIAR